MTTARAHTNIALIKYWGKRDSQLILPYTSSISMTLDEFYTDTQVVFDAALTADELYLDGTKRDVTKVATVLELVRQQAHESRFARVTSTNHVPETAGLASSASAFAALTMAASAAAGLKLSHTQLSRLARRGSGSASRSVDGGFVIWHRGTDDQSSFAEPIREQPTLPLAMVVVMVSGKKKSQTSRQGMAQTVATSPFYPAFVEQNQAAIEPMLHALATDDLATIGRLTEQSSFQMHAAIMAGNPPFSYFEPETLTAWHMVQTLRDQGIPAYATMDAGPNVKILTTQPHVDTILKALEPEFAGRLTVAHPGPAAQILSEE
ncbi:diphosphomevalonate decarboxylase [Lacticaseibacillus saniviri]|uniref:diphosphomevalonate decarboxylase n=1 Tax=Lacticaseibacillus saniviri JCM 17471 = DSM 24301 TaxID=1293598 RepID=A0A0R2N2F0_9LACO|nr:diphosphomevalonate decarboxylase [Lacticaseibacillus saniviri]KRO18205.1 Diphosphomevalonate decarboxylase [Lacticaseibacillus saniviri JCM 17471 = DSM 24301]MCG4281373.1 diphosphomevalonate decarboxylase [Lacticaseibacillus saniviri]